MTASANANPAPTPSRREFLNYAFGASIALMLIGLCVGIVWFMQQPVTKPQYLEDHGYFQLDLTQIPKIDAAPVRLIEQRVWLVNTNEGLLALYGVSPDDHCLPKWAASNHRFEDPCHGSKFQIDSTYIEGPAQRGMGRFALTVTTDHGKFETPEDGSPVPIEGATSILLNTTQIIPGNGRYNIYSRGSLY